MYNQEFEVKQATRQFIDSLEHPQVTKVTERRLSTAKRKNLLRRIEGVNNA